MLKIIYRNGNEDDGKIHVYVENEREVINGSYKPVQLQNGLTGYLKTSSVKKENGDTFFNIIKLRCNKENTHYQILLFTKEITKEKNHEMTIQIANSI